MLLAHLYGVSHFLPHSPVEFGLKGITWWNSRHSVIRVRCSPSIENIGKVGVLMWQDNYSLQSFFLFDPCNYLYELIQPVKSSSMEIIFLVKSQRPNRTNIKYFKHKSCIYFCFSWISIVTWRSPNFHPK